MTEKLLFIGGGEPGTGAGQISLEEGEGRLPRAQIFLKGGMALVLFALP
ncbi:MAG: hypothetical protein SVY10_19560 [Thermodesulfobacteriota bacterium]|nr:hypothetical protein [Thermodesulfobacteriota bacterium]